MYKHHTYLNKITESQIQRVCPSMGKDISLVSLRSCGAGCYVWEGSYVHFMELLMLSPVCGVDTCGFMNTYIEYNAQKYFCITCFPIVICAWTLHINLFWTLCSLRSEFVFKFRPQTLDALTHAKM